MVQRSIAAATADGEHCSDALVYVNGCDVNIFNHCSQHEEGFRREQAHKPARR